MESDNAARLILDNVEAVRQQIAISCGRSGRQPPEVELLAVTKYVDATALRHLHAAGLRTIGENTIQGTVRKREHGGP